MRPCACRDLETAKASAVPVLPVSSEPSVFLAAYERHRDAIRAVPEREVMPLNIDIQAAITLVRGAWPRLVAERAAIAGLLSPAQLEAFDRIDEYALAAGHLHALYLFTEKPDARTSELRTRAAELRDGLFIDARALARHGLLDGQRLAAFERRPGYRNTAFDLLGLVNVLRDAWPSVAGRTALRAETLLEAEELANELSLAIGARVRAPEVVARAAFERQQAFTLLARAYDQARRAITFLRWDEGDADSIAPSLYGGRKRRRAKPEKADETPSVPSPSSELVREASEASSMAVAEDATGAPSGR